MQQAYPEQAPRSVLTRRSALLMTVASSLLAPRAVRAATTAPTLPPAPFADAAVLVVAGPDDGPLAQVSEALKAGLDSLLPADRHLQLRHAGGADGVTAANQFEARVLPDGQTALLVPGEAAMAWLRGDPRAQYDVGHWLPVATALVPGVVVLRAGVPQSGGLRLVVQGDVTLALPASLGLDLAGMPVAKVSSVDDALAALRNGIADAAFLRGERAAVMLAEAKAAGMTALFSLGSLDPENRLQRDPFLPDVPTLPELLFARPQPPSAALLAAWHGAAAASRLEMALLLPWLTPPGLVAWWRGACGQISMPRQQDVARPELGAQVSRVWRTDPNGNFGLSTIVLENSVSLTLHRWMTTQPN